MLGCLAWWAPVSAQNGEKDYGEEEGDYIVEDSAWMLTADTAAFYYEEGEFIIPGMLPEYDFYAFWDTMHVDAYRFDLRKLQETIPLTVLEMDCDFAMPIYGKTNSPFGWRHGRPHTGIDLQLRTGDSVYAMFDGVVRMSKYYNGYGNCVVVRHYNGLETLYAHLSKLEVRPGMLINAGQLLGLGGSTGHRTGPTLHFEIRFLGQTLKHLGVCDFPNQTIHKQKPPNKKKSNNTTTKNKTNNKNKKKQQKKKKKTYKKKNHLQNHTTTS